MQKLQDVHEAYQVLTKVNCSIHHTSRGIEMILAVQNSSIGDLVTHSLSDFLF